MTADPRFATLSKRLLARPRPDAWLGLVIRAFPAAGETGEGPPHWLVAGWRADDDGLVPRLPEFAAIASPDRERIRARYTDREAGYERMWRTLTGGDRDEA